MSHSMSRISVEVFTFEAVLVVQTGLMCTSVSFLTVRWMQVFVVVDCWLRCGAINLIE